MLRTAPASRPPGSRRERLTSREEGAWPTTMAEVAGPRLIALVGPFASGKTSLLEAILAPHRRDRPPWHISRTEHAPAMGRLEARSHQMSVEANIADTDFMGDRLTPFIDCPGSVRVRVRGQRGPAAADLAVVVAESDPKKVAGASGDAEGARRPEYPRASSFSTSSTRIGSVRELLATLQPASAVPLVLRHIPSARTASSPVSSTSRSSRRSSTASTPSEVVAILMRDRAREAEARYAMLEALAD